MKAINQKDTITSTKNPNNSVVLAPAAALSRSGIWELSCNDPININMILFAVRWFMQS
jgi:hypothetical protein